MKLTTKIDAYAQMAKELKEVTSDVYEVSYRIEDVSIADMRMLSDHYCKELDATIVKDKVALFLRYPNCSIYIYSEKCEIKTTIEFTPIVALEHVA